MGKEPGAAAAAILKEAAGAHRTSREILGLMQEPASEDPIATIIAMLGTIVANQQAMLTRLDIIERRLASPR